VSSPVSVDIKAPHRLSGVERAAWDEFLSLEPVWRTPFRSYAFAEAAAAARSDARVLVIRRGGRIEAFLPLHLSPTGYARPLGGPVSDLHGLVARPDAQFNLVNALGHVGVGAFAFSCAPAAQTLLAPFARASAGYNVADLSDGYDAYLSDRHALRKKAFKKLDVRRRKAERAGDVVVRIEDPSPKSFVRLIRWKSAQYAAAGHPNPFHRPWLRRLFKMLIESRSPDCRGIVSSLEVGGVPVAAHFGLIGDGVLQLWFSAYDPAHGDFSPGQLLRQELMRAAPGLGVSQVHLGPGEAGHKGDWTSYQIPVISGRVDVNPLFTVALAAAERIESRAERLPLGRVGAWPGKAFRRVDQYCAFRPL